MENDWKQSDSIDQLASALAEAQGELEAAKKTSKNPFFKSTYADLSEVVSTLKPVFPKNGLSYIQLPGIAGSLSTQVMHKSGQWIRQTATVTLSKTDPQSVGSAITYMRRYGLTGAAGLATEDDDGNGASQGDSKDKKVTTKPKTAANVVKFKYQIWQLDDDKQLAAQRYLEENGAQFDDEASLWVSDKPLKRLEAYQQGA